MTYEVRVRRSAQRDIRRLPPAVRERIRDAIVALGDVPRPRGARRLVARVEVYRIRVGDYRVIYVVFDDQRLVTVGRVEPRSEKTYRRLKDLFD